MPTVARLAWFSPMPPVASGVATCSAALVAVLGTEHHIDVFVDESVVRVSPRTRSAHDFVWLHHQRPYDLIVYQLGNSSHHDYQWPYLFRYPGLTVLHDAHLHHARAAWLLRTSRSDHYRAEFAWNHAEVSPDLAELAVAGFDNHLYFTWPMTRLVTRASRLVAVHCRALADRLREDVPYARIEAIHLGHGTPLSATEEEDLRFRTRRRYAIAPDALVFGCYGGLTVDKRVPQVLSAFAATCAYVPAAHLLLAGAAPEHYDVRADVERHGLQDCATLTGYLRTEQEFTGCIAACDVALNLRWPTAREVSGPWLHCLAAGKPTVIVDLAHLVEVPSIDPHTWQPNTLWPGSGIRGSPFGRLRATLSGVEGSGSGTRGSASSGTFAPCSVAIDILDEDHSLRQTMRRLATDPSLRAALGRAARQYWSANHSVDVMIADYRRVIADALQSPVPRPPLPAHLVDDGTNTLEQVVARFGLTSPFHAGLSAGL